MWKSLTLFPSWLWNLFKRIAIKRLNAFPSIEGLPPMPDLFIFYLCSENIELSGLLYSWFSNFSQIQIKHMLTQSRLDILWKWNYSILHASDLKVPSWCQHEMESFKEKRKQKLLLVLFLWILVIRSGLRIKQKDLYIRSICHSCNLWGIIRRLHKLLQLVGPGLMKTFSCWLLATCPLFSGEFFNVFLPLQSLWWLGNYEKK